MLTPNPARITAAADGQALSVTGVSGPLTASTLTRTLQGDVVRYATCRDVACSCCTYGRTSAGRLKVAPGALRFPTPIDRVKLTREHVREDSRGHVAAAFDDGTVLRISARVSDGPVGDTALREATDKTRDGFSFDVIDAVIEGDTITSALVIAVGQVGIPAFDDMRIDTVAASHQTARAAAAGTPQEGRAMLTPEELAELTQLAGMERSALTEAQTARLDELVAKLTGDSSSTSSDTTATASTATASTPTPAPAPPAAVAASLAGGSVPSGVGATRAPARTSSDGALRAFVRTVTDALQPGGGGAGAITAALTDVTQTAIGGDLDQPAWSGELWAGVEYVPVFSDLFSQGDLTNYEGQGWRWVTKPAMADYAGDKAAVPSGAIDTEPSTYTAARMAVGHDFDRKFYDFPNEAFLTAYVQAVRESWAMRLDDKVAAYTVANAVTVAGGASTDILKAAARAVRAVRNARAGAASFVVVSEDDVEDLMDVTAQSLPAFLQLFNIDPSNWRVAPASQLAGGKVIAGARQAATVRTLPGSPIRVSAQHIANGGIDEAFFGYWAVEEHHTSGIAAVTYTPGA